VLHTGAFPLVARSVEIWCPGVPASVKFRVERVKIADSAEHLYRAEAAESGRS
jgi:hypothetical protein